MELTLSKFKKWAKHWIDNGQAKLWQIDSESGYFYTDKLAMLYIIDGDTVTLEKG